MSESDKPQGKVEIKIGNLTFSAEGEQAWLADQLSKVIDAAASAANATPENSHTPTGSQGASTAFTDSLATYLKTRGAEDKQVERFLATANWLRRRGLPNLTTAAVAKALADNHQKRLGNPSDCLNQNVSKGYCEKTKDGFFITPEGLAKLSDNG